MLQKYNTAIPVGKSCCGNLVANSKIDRTSQLLHSTKRCQQRAARTKFRDAVASRTAKPEYAKVLPELSKNRPQHVRNFAKGTICFYCCNHRRHQVFTI